MCTVPGNSNVICRILFYIIFELLIVAIIITVTFINTNATIFIIIIVIICHHRNAGHLQLYT